MNRILLFAFSALFLTSANAQLWYEQYPDLNGSTISELSQDATGLTAELSQNGFFSGVASFDETDGQVISSSPPTAPICSFNPGFINAFESSSFVIRAGFFAGEVTVIREDFEYIFPGNCRIRDTWYSTNVTLPAALETNVSSILIEGQNVYVAGYQVYDTDRSYSFFVARLNRFSGDVLSTFIGTTVTPAFNIPNPTLLKGLTNGDVLLQVPSTGVGGGATSDFLRWISADGSLVQDIGYGRGLSSILDIQERASGEVALLTATDNGTSRQRDLILFDGLTRRTLTYSGRQNFGAISLLDFAPSALTENQSGQLLLAGRTSTVLQAGGLSAGTAVVITSGADAIEDLVYVDAFTTTRDPNEILELDNGDYLVAFATPNPSLARIAGLSAPPAAVVDLELDIIAMSSNQYSVYTNIALLSNTGTADAHDIVVSFPRPLGTVYTGGNEFVADAGNFSPYGNQQWVIPTLEAGETISLTVNLFLLDPVPGFTYAQVLAQAEPDADSTPGNGVSPIVAEDDEALEGTVPTNPGGGTGTGDEVDIELYYNTTSTTVGIFTSFSVELTALNASTNDATGVEVYAPSSFGAVFIGGNEFTSSQGSYNPYHNQTWNVGSIAAGESATLTLNFFLLTNDQLDLYVQVVSTTEIDSDSNPRNGTCCTPNEDDEALLVINGPGSIQPLILKANEVLGKRPVTITSVYPNVLTTFDVVVQVVANEEGEWPLIAYNMLGQAKQIAQLQLITGINEVSVDVSELPSGAYRLTIPVDGLRVISEPLMINR